MREVEHSRVVRAAPATVEGALTPASLVEYEGTFAVRDVRESEEGTGPTTVVAEGGGMALTLRFERLDDGLRYVQADESGPFDAFETAVTVRPEGGGAHSLVRARSTVSLDLPVPLIDYLAGWKRRNELRRALDGLAADCE